MEQILANYRRAAKYLTADDLELMPNATIEPRWRNAEWFWYPRRSRDGIEYVAVNGQGVKQPLFDHEALANGLSVAVSSPEPIDAAKLQLEDLKWSKEGKWLHFCALGRKWRFSVPDNDLIDEGASCVQTGDLLSPDGKMATFLSAHQIFLRDIETAAVRQLTTDGVEAFAYGTSPQSNTFSVTLRLAGIVLPPAGIWSPDSSKFLCQRIDERLVEPLHLLQFAPPGGTVRPRCHSFRYPMPGDSHVAVAHLYVIDVETGQSVQVRHPGAASPLFGSVELGQVWWNASGDAIYWIEQSRDCTSLRLLKVNPNNGECQTLYEERSDTYVEPGPTIGIGHNIRVLGNGQEVIWWSQCDGWGHLYLVNTKDGEATQITRGTWSVANILHIDEVNRVIVFSGVGREVDCDPYLRRIYRICFDGSGLELLTPEDADHQVIERGTHFSHLVLGEPDPEIGGFSPNGEVFVESYSRADRPANSILRSASNGEILAELEHADLSRLDALGYRWPKPFSAKAADGITDIFGLLFFPSDFDPRKTYPLIDNCYPGPQSNRVKKDSLTIDRIAQSVAELGFIVVQIDGRGKPGRSRDFHRESYGRLELAGGLADHVAAYRQLGEKCSFIDLNRIGIFGHSGGGFMAARAMLDYPEVYRAAVASAGNHDQRGYLSLWGEKYHGPYSPDLYAAQVNASHVEKLKGKLLLACGDMDENVHPALTIQLAEALIKANKDFDFLFLPNCNHTMLPHRYYFYRKMWDFFVRNLLNVEPPVEFLIESCEKS